MKVVAVACVTLMLFITASTWAYGAGPDSGQVKFDSTTFLVKFKGDAPEQNIKDLNDRMGVSEKNVIPHREQALDMIIYNLKISAGEAMSRVIVTY